MSRFDHVLARRMESARPSRWVRRAGVRVKTEPRHTQGSPWWRERFVDLIEQRKRKAAR